MTADNVAVVLRERAVRYDEQLDVSEQDGAGPETVALVAVNLVKRLTDVHTATLEFDVDHRQAIHQHRDVVAVLAGAFDLVLVDRLQPVVVNVRLVDQRHVLDRTVVALQQLDVVILNTNRLVDDTVVAAGDPFAEESFPSVSENVTLLSASSCFRRLATSWAYLVIGRNSYA